MNDSLHKDLSVYQLALGVEAPSQTVTLNPATLLSLVRAQIDLLIEQQISATLWIKLPPGKIWTSELVRYQSSMGESSNIYNCQVGEGKLELGEEKLISLSSLYDHYLDVRLLPNNNLPREYFLLVLSPRFCSLIAAYRPRQNNKISTLDKAQNSKNQPLFTITSVDNQVIQRVLDGIKQEIVPESKPITPSDFICPNACEPALISQLLTKQLQRQNEINRRISVERIAKLQQHNQKLQTKEQLKDEYLTNVCQELRTPLTQMKTALSLLNSPTLKPHQRQRYLQMLNTQCDRQSVLITGLMTLVELEHNLEATTLELVKLVDIVPGVVSTYQPVAQEKGIMLGYTIPTDLPTVWCVNGGLRQIVIHLLHNSLKFTPKGGQVWVRAKVQGEYVQLEIRDTGIGISETEIPKIFDCFYRVRSGLIDETNGAGLGLTIVQRLLWHCGGSINVRSKIDEGTMVIVQMKIGTTSPT
ncbi:DICT sensory domain-containing protein [Anabaena subtropica]|uniref:histidine kinase n=1 Tax=Anabaena subtropica FACHB-260 TaxID=2692884 RepID=A0ABR8CHQ1_9NOST|nr:DICT sensory domain-containing protein [Anabaena subtropica]MBD2342722.1 ATPase [Anabaena subtropica FACHB-260]